MKDKKIVIPTIKPRNHTVMAMAGLKGGSHKKSNKSLRKKDKQELKKETSNKEVFCFELLLFI